MNFSTDALLALIVVVGGWVGTLFTGDYITTWEKLSQALIGVVVVVALVYVRYVLKKKFQDEK
jgi:hypothetical protein